MNARGIARITPTTASGSISPAVSARGQSRSSPDPPPIPRAAAARYITGNPTSACTSASVTRSPLAPPITQLATIDTPIIAATAAHVRGAAFSPTSNATMVANENIRALSDTQRENMINRSRLALIQGAHYVNICERSRQILHRSKLASPRSSSTSC